MELVSFATLDGRPYVTMIEGRLIVAHLIMLRLRSCREWNTIHQSICGVLVCSLMNFWLEKRLSITWAVNKPWNVSWTYSSSYLRLIKKYWNSRLTSRTLLSPSFKACYGKTQLQGWEAHQYSRILFYSSAARGQNDLIFPYSVIVR